MRNAFVYLRPAHVAYIRAVGPYALSSREAWAAVMAWLERSGTRRATGCGYGLLLDNPKTTTPEKCRYDACIVVDEAHRELLTADFGFRRLPGGAFARKRHSGSIDAIGSVIAELRDNWVAMNGLQLDPGRPLIEIYMQDPKTVPAERLRVDICVPIKAEFCEGQSAA